MTLLELQHFYRGCSSLGISKARFSQVSNCTHQASMFDVNHASHIIRSARIKKNLTQSALADLMGVTYQAVSNWERESFLPDISKLENLCSALGINLSELIGTAEDAKLANEVINGSCDYTNDSAEIIASIAPLIPPGQLMDMVKKTKSQ